MSSSRLANRPLAGAVDRALPRLGTLAVRIGPSLLVLVGYLVLSAAVFGHDALPHLKSMVVGFGQAPAFYGRDQSAYTWFLAWGEHQLATGPHDPLSTSALFAPLGYNLSWAASIQGPALLMSPITDLAGAVVSFNLLATAAPAVAAWTAYLLCRQVSPGPRAPALAGGLLFGFGTYEAVEMVNHLNLALVGLIPLALLLALLRYRGQISRLAFIAGLGLIVVAQLWTSTELLATMAVFAAIALVLAALLGGRERRGTIGRLGLEALGGLAFGALLGAPFIYHAYHYENPAEGLAGSWDSADLLNLIAPTKVTWLWEIGFHSIKYPSSQQNLSEEVAYLGVPLLALLVSFAITSWRTLTGRLLTSFLVVVLVLSLGAHLVVNGSETGVWLPWDLVTQLPALKAMMPGRFALYIWLAVAIATTLWLAQPGRKRWRWALFALAVGCLLPNFTGVPWGTRVDSPPLMSSPTLARYVPPGSTVLALPYGIFGDSMSWQREAGFSFKLAGGYAGIAVPNLYVPYLDSGLISALGGSRIESDQTPQLCSFLATTRSNEILLREHTPGMWGQLLDPLRLTPTRVGGFAIYDVAPVFEAGGACTMTK